MGLFNKPLLSAHYDNEDVQISAELCTNIAINIIGLAKGEITIMSGNDDMIQIKTSVQAKESILKNAAALEPVQDGDRYTYTIHTPLESRLEKAVTFQALVVIPKSLDALESFSIMGTNLELSIGNISHTFIRNLTIVNGRGDITIESFYGEVASIKSTIAGGICGKYKVAQLVATAKSGKIRSDVRLVNTENTDMDQHRSSLSYTSSLSQDLGSLSLSGTSQHRRTPSNKVVCSTLHHSLAVAVDGTELSKHFTVEAKTATAPLDAKVLLANPSQRLLGNFINFGGPVKIRLSGNYQGRIEARTHYGKIFIDEPEFERIEGATLTVPSLSDRNGASASSTAIATATSEPIASSPTRLSPPVRSYSHQSTSMSARTPSQGTTMSCALPEDQPIRSHGLTPSSHQPPSEPIPQLHCQSAPGSSSSSSASSRAGSLHGSINETRSVHTTKSDKSRKKDDEKDSVVTREVIGRIGQGPGLIMVKNSSGDITMKLV
ncbi:hypothetical protein BGW38_008804 [Lunasporangiospora selenospora]|uniref:Adhesin domain-containing protein n=1 Tax=Lunasporangiospora selenospora TaxID=979761 RepID=A0A9P6FXJ9_9FUNG|nr:hypothetical protein BGW38_008804 [Lunasporangiospora selenospora]